MKVRPFLLLLVGLGVVLGLFFGVGDARHLAPLGAAALVAGAVVIAGSRSRGGMLGEFGVLYWLPVLTLTVWAISEIEHGGATIAGGGLVSAALLVGFPPQRDEPETEDSERD